MDTSKRRINKAVKNSTMQLFTANMSIKTYGEKLFVLNLELRRPFQWIFCVADVTTPIIGADFLYNFDLSVDLRRRRLHDNQTGIESKGQLTSESHVTISVIPDSPHYKLFYEFPGLTRPSQPSGLRPHGVRYHIQTKSSPIAH